MVTLTKRQHARLKRVLNHAEYVFQRVEDGGVVIIGTEMINDCDQALEDVVTNTTEENT